MNLREKRMAIAVAALVGLLGLYYAYSSVAESFSQREKTIANLKQDVAKRERVIAEGNKAQKRMDEWRKRSLPSKSDRAPSMYVEWLSKLAVETAKLESSEAKPTSTTGKNTVYEKFGFEVKGQSDISMKQLVQFLYEFYTQHQLHKIRHLHVKPTQDNKKLEVTITIEALLLPGADRTDKLSTETAKLPLGDVAAYQKSISQRNLFVEYTPPPPIDRGRPAGSPPFDAAKFTFLSGVTSVPGEPSVAWIRVQTTGEEFRPKEGEEFKVGEAKFKVVKIGVRDAVITTEGKTVHVSLGGNLRDAPAVPAEEL